jgi:hypothetical protein
MRKTLKQKNDDSILEMNELQKKHDLLLKRYNEQEQKARTHRLCKRGGYVEKHLPELIPLTDKQFYAFVEKVMQSHFARKVLAELTAENADTAEPQNGSSAVQASNSAVPVPAVALAQRNPLPAQKPAGAPRSGGTGGANSGGNFVARTS